MLACALMASGAQAEDKPAPAGSPPLAMPSPAASPRSHGGCQVAADIASRVGVSINGDQWLFGAQLRSGLPCLGELGFGPMFALGVGGNYLTVRSSGRLDYLFWLDDAHAFGIYPALGASVLFYAPVGPFADFCKRTSLDECWGYELGFEIGGGLRYGWFGADAFLGFDGLPIVTLMAFVSTPLTRPEAGR